MKYIAHFQWCAAHRPLTRAPTAVPGARPTYTERLVALGYELIGQSKVTCLSSGHWSNSIPSCQRMNLLILRFNVFDFSERHVINRIIKLHLTCTIFSYIHIMIGHEVTEHPML